MIETGALVVGIGNYAYPRQDQFPPLAFATTDADAVARYLQTCWPTEDRARIVRIDEQNATIAGIGRGFTELQKSGPFELLFVFLSGHGLVDGELAGFLCQPEADQSSYQLLAPTALDALLTATPAKRTVVILDCCFAEGIVGRMEFFSRLGTDMARLYMASSRETQRTWEDEGAQHGVFTAHLLDLLNTGSSTKLGGVRDVLDVDGELFPVICDQVPLYVFTTKGQIQEPVKGGVSSATVTLPVGRTARRLNEQTALGTALRRVRQIGLGVAAGIGALLCFSYTMLYYVEPDASGSLTVHRGTRWLEPVFRFLPDVRVDTGINVRDLSANPAASRPLEGGYTTGVWTHLTADGYRSWYETVAAGLEPSAAARYEVLLGTRGSAASNVLNEFSLPSDIAAAAWSAMARSQPIELDAILKHLPVDFEEPLLTPFNPDKLDFNVLDRSVGDMEAFASALDYSAAIDPVRTMPVYLRFAKATQEWLAHNTDAQRGRDARATVRNAVAGVLAVIVRARKDRGMPALDSGSTATIKALSAMGYSNILDSAVGQIPDPAAASAAAAHALESFRGDPFDTDQERALRAIMTSLDGSRTAQSMTDQVYARFAQAGNSMNPYLSRYLIAAGDTKSLSPTIVARLLGQTRMAAVKPERDFMDSELARILAHGMRQVPTKDRAVVYRLIDLVARDTTPKSTSTAEMYAALGKHRLDPPGMLAKVEAQARKAPPYSPHDPADPGTGLPGMSVVVGYGPWVAALALYGQSRELPAHDIEILRDHLRDPALRDLIIPALAAQEKTIVRGDPVEQWVRELRSVPQDSMQRQIRESIFTARLAALDRGAFEGAIRTLRAARIREAEPEVRIAIGTVIADAQFWRVRTPAAGQALFQ
ncbi:caspase domain-containing protein [Hephaestia caeni]|uniref:Caspase domain-containing protein n=1 Tax=Hephaestia caeni TaxID=645617 RepID=A0A397PGQ0_9SPHN|nr:caspase family protein [Hephaestia caeni]RIA46347.1 caspase domain-containing protein [Hephaestia caeni]